METDIIYNEDCLKGLSKIQDKSIDLIVIDPPYNIKKDSWDDIKNYEEWMKEVILELQRILKDNGSFYMFHSEMEIVSDFMNFLKEKTNFIFRQFIVWNKRFDGSPRKGFLDGYCCVDMLRNYQQMAEYILYYTFDTQKKISIFLRNKRDKTKKTIKQVAKEMRVYQALYGFYEQQNSCSQIPTNEQWDKLKSILDFEEELEELDYTFNNQKTHHSVWNYDIENKIGHTTPKPLKLIKNIILHSSKEGQIVLDCFMGSGTTALACKELNRRYIGFEKDPEYCKIISKRLSQQTLSNLSATPRTLPNGNPNGEFNNGLEVSATPTPKSPSATSPNPNNENRKVFKIRNP